MISLGAAMHGAGFALAHDTLAVDLLREGRLVKPFTTELELNEAYFLIPPSGNLETSASDDFCQWILQQTGRA